MAKIFISHTEADEATAAEIAEKLAQHAVEVWLNRIGVMGEVKSPEKIVKAINWADAFVLVWSEAASESHEVMFEWTNALNLRKPIILCLLENAVIPDSLPQESPIYFKNFDTGFNDLLLKIQDFCKIEDGEKQFPKSTIITSSPSKIRNRNGLPGKDVSIAPVMSSSEKQTVNGNRNSYPSPIRKSRDWYKLGSVLAGVMVVILVFIIIVILNRQKNRDGIFRSNAAVLTEDIVIENIRRHHFFDARHNMRSDGFGNLFRIQIIQADTIAIDDASGLMWQDSGFSYNAMPIDLAYDYIKRLNESKYAGFTNWRLPTLEEAMTLLEPLKNELGIHSNFSSGVWQEKILTSDKLKFNDLIWIVNFLEGYCSKQRKTDQAYIKAVRSQ